VAIDVDEVGRPPRVHWYHRPGWLVVLILFVLGPLAIPLVWGSPVLSRRGKIVLTSVAVAYTLATVGGLVDVAYRMIGVLHDAGIELSLR
jgi:hypothetical protein